MHRSNNVVMKNDYIEIKATQKTRKTKKQNAQCKKDKKVNKFIKCVIIIS